MPNNPDYIICILNITIDYSYRLYGITVLLVTIGSYLEVGRDKDSLKLKVLAIGMQSVT